MGQCIGPVSFGYAIQDLLDSQQAQPLSLSIAPWKQEPDLRTGSSPIDIVGTVTVEGLISGTKYDIYRWGSVEEAFTYNEKYRKTTFTATSDTHVYKDPQTFSSGSSTYYRCVKSSVRTLLCRCRSWLTSSAGILTADVIFWVSLCFSSAILCVHDRFWFVLSPSWSEGVRLQLFHCENRPSLAVLASLSRRSRSTAAV